MNRLRRAPADREQQRRAQGEAAIAPHQQLAAVVEIGGVPGGKEQHEAGQKLGETNVSEIERALRDLVHLPSHSDGLHLERHDDEEARERIGDEVGIGESYSPGKARVFGTGREHSLLLCHRIIHASHLLQAVDERGDVACAESVIYVDYADVRGAGVHHPEQSGEALEGCAITNARRDGNHGNSHQPADYAGKRAFHSGADYDHTRFRERSAMRQQAVDARDSDVIDMLNVIAHQFGGDDRFLGDRDVAGSRGHDHDHALAVPLAIALEHDGASDWAILWTIFWTIFCPVRSGGDGGILFLGSSGRQHVTAMGGQAVEDVRHLARRFALGKHHFRHALAQGTMVVDLGETEILKGQVTQALYGLVGGETLFSDLLEQLAKSLGIHADVIVDWRGLGTAADCKINHGGHRGAWGNSTGKTGYSGLPFGQLHGLMWCFVEGAFRIKIK